MDETPLLGTATPTRDPAWDMLDNVWERLGCQVFLPGGEEAFLDPDSLAAAAPDDRRLFRRVRFRRRALLLVEGRHYAIYTTNISVVGLAALHHEPLEPGQEVRVRFDVESRIDYQVRRCRRVGPGCFEWAGHVLPGQQAERVVRALLRQGRTRAIPADRNQP